MTGSCNGTMMTVNYVSIMAKGTGGDNLSNVVLMIINNATKSPLYEGPAMTDSAGYWAENCIGVVVNQAGKNFCINATVFDPPNQCLVHAISFPVDMGATCPINSTSTIYAMDFISSNLSQKNVTPGVPLTMNLDTPSSMANMMVFEWSPNNMQQQESQMNIQQINVSDYVTGELYSVVSGGEQGGGMPAFIRPYKLYNITFTYNGMTYRFPFMTPSSGPTGAQIYIGNSTTFPPSTGYKTFVGKVVNSTNNPVANVTVYSQFYKGPGGAFGIFLFSSAVTDNNGRFSLRVPKTMRPEENPQGQFFFPTYQFYLVSNKRNANGVTLYFPTIDNNDDKGYFALSDTNVLPPLILKSGGVVDANVTLNGASLVMSELSKFNTIGTGVDREAVTGKFNMLKIFETVSLPATMFISLVSPTGSPVVNLFGKNVSFGDPMSGNITTVCFNISATVSQGAIAPITCNLTAPGYLNLTVRSCESIFDVNVTNPSKCTLLSDNSRSNMRVGSFNFWFDTNGILRDAADNVVLYLSPSGTLLENLLTWGVDAPSISIPLPPGDYKLELSPAFEFTDYLGAYNSTAFTIAAGQTTNLIYTRGKTFNINPMFNPSMVLSDNNTIEISVSPRQGGMLNDSNVTLNARVIYLNRSLASNRIIRFFYNSTKNAFMNKTFQPSAFGLSPGKYMILMNVTANTTKDVQYRTTMLMPIHAYDFQLGLDIGGFTFGTNQVASGKIYAFNATGPIETNTSPIIIEMFDNAGIPIPVTVALTEVANGMADINITMPSNLGFYDITVKVNSSEKYGVADNWVQVSNINIKTMTDRQGYQPGDNVTVTVQISNSSSGIGIANASVEISVDNSDKPAFGSTDSNGKATIILDPAKYAGSGQTSWAFAWHNLRIKISKDYGTDVVKTETWFGFDVRGFDLFIRPEKPSYGIAENVTIMIFGPPPGSYSIAPKGVKVDGTTLDQGPLNDCVPTPGITFCVSDEWGGNAKEVNIGNWSAGMHGIEFKISATGGEQWFRSGFSVSEFTITLSTDKFSYELKENVTLTVKANYPNGTAVAEKNVTAKLYKAQPPNDILVNQTNGTTDSSGKVVLKLNASKPGFNYIAVNVSGQMQFIGVQVSTVRLTLLNEPDGNATTNYNAAPGNTVKIYVNATYGSNAVPDGSVVKATLWAFGNSVDFPTNTTSGGQATLSMSISSFAPTQVYGLEVRLTTPSGEQGFAPQSTLTVSGGNSLQLRVYSDRSFMQPYRAGDTASFTSVLSYPNGTGVDGQSITLEIGSEGSQPQVIGTAVTGAAGNATVAYSIASNNTEGPYFLHAYITNNSDVQAYSGFMISNLVLNVVAERNTYSLGETIRVNVTVFNRTGGQTDATSGFVFTFNKEKGEINQMFNPSGSTQPYHINISVPNEASAVGSYPIGIVMFMNQSQGFGFALVDVKNASKSLNLTLPASITAGTNFTVNITASSGTNATLRIFSPAAAQLIYDNSSIDISAGSAAFNVSINSPGVYVFNAFVNGIGSTTAIMSVSAPTSGTIPLIWTGTSITTNASAFTTSQDVYILSNTANSTATVLSLDSSTNVTTSLSIPLSPSGDIYYGIMSSSNLVSGRAYFVRLDTSTSSGAATSMFSVS